MCRANLHDWYGQKHNEPIYAERAKTLRIDLRLQKIRGEIDDTRIYVDPNRFLEWLQDSLFGELSSVLRTQRISVIDITFTDTKPDLVSQQKPANRMANLISKAFLEFYDNTKFGISSYLGRRIRHGTLKGTMVTPVRSLIESERFVALTDNPDCGKLLRKWLTTYELGVEELSREYLQIRGNRNSKALFDTDIFRPDRARVLKAAIGDIDATYTETESFTHINAKIYSYCWRFAESDLRQVRDFLRNCRSDWGKIDAAQLRRSLPNEWWPELNSLAKELNTLLDDRFRTITSWFNEPKNLSPSAPLGLLFQAVMSEVKESFSNFKPNILADDLDTVLTGGTYHLIYDALYVVVHNAAKHGRLNGDLACKFTISDSTSGAKELLINISSETGVGVSDEDVRKKMNDAMLGSYDDALAEEGRSGFKKLLRMKKDTAEMSQFSAECRNGKVNVLLAFRLQY